MGNIEDGPPNADTKKATEKFEDAVKTTEGSSSRWTTRARS